MSDNKERLERIVQKLEAHWHALVGIRDELRKLGKNEEANHLDKVCKDLDNANEMLDDAL